MKTTTNQPFRCPICDGKWDQGVTYRFLTDKDIFQAGDEVLLSSWGPVVPEMFGKKVPSDFNHYRRPERVTCKSCTYGIIWGTVTTTYDWPYDTKPCIEPYKPYTEPYLPWKPLEPYREPEPYWYYTTKVGDSLKFTYTNSPGL